MEFVEEEARPRFLFQSRAAASSSSAQAPPEALKIDKLHAMACLAAASLLLFSAFSVFQSETLTFLLVWIALSLLVAPFAPPSVTGGDVRVGRGELLEPADPAPPEPEEPKKRIPGRRIRSRKPDDLPPVPPAPAASGSGVSEKSEGKAGDPIRNGNGSAKDGEGEAEEEREWSDEDFEILKKQISKHPVGEPRRWERIAEAFRGRHGLESVIKTAKSLSEKRPAAGDSFAQFLKQRKPLDKRAEAINGDSTINGRIPLEECDPKNESDGGSVSWSAGEDLALLNALKAFPKDVSLRWEKIAAAVPGKSKACCIKRISELKRDFRSSKGSET